MGWNFDGPEDFAFSGEGRFFVVSALFFSFSLRHSPWGFN